MIPPRTSPRPLLLLTAAEMRAWDALAIDRSGIPERLLMESAGRAAAHVAARLHPDGTIVAAVGAGNNGGDAVVMLRTLRAWGREVVAVPVGDARIPDHLRHGWDLPVAGDLADACRGAALVVDGILGTGATGAPREPAAAAVRAMNASGLPVLALDGPTGVDLSDGSVAGDAVRATATVTFGAPKRGLLLHPGRAHAGRVIVVESGFPPLQEPSAAGLVTREWASHHLPPRAPDAHKGSAGQVLVVAGGRGTGGAAIMVAMGALRAGAGMARIASPDVNRAAIHAALPEAVFVGLDPEALDAALDRSDAVVIGPGTGFDAVARAALARVIAAGHPVVVDADALTLAASDPGLLGTRPERLLLTPHPGEMARLLDVEIGAVTRAPIETAATAAGRFGCAVLLKGAPAVVAMPGGQVLVNPTGHSGVATGGMGDTLAGVAGAMMAAGASPGDAGVLALFYAGRAAEIAGRGRALLPRDVAETLPAALLEAPSAHPVPGVVLDLPAPS